MIDGSEVDFWRAKWIGEKSLCTKFNCTFWTPNKKYEDCTDECVGRARMEVAVNMEDALVLMEKNSFATNVKDIGGSTKKWWEIGGCGS